jgi:hypothetical protein
MNLVERFEELFGNAFVSDTRQAPLFTLGERVPENELRECAAMALTYHVRQNHVPTDFAGTAFSEDATTRKGSRIGAATRQRNEPVSRSDTRRRL